MKLSPGDHIQIILTVGGVPYATTKVISTQSMPVSLAAAMMRKLITDIDLYADESAIGD
jgi:hypothetical protein